MSDVFIIKTGVANIASMIVAFERLGAHPRLTDDAAHVREGDFVVLPGVGAFGAGIERLEQLGMRDALVGRVEAGKPLLSVCLGLQLLCETSEESPGVRGLGIIPSKVTRFPEDVRIPQFGWNEVVAQPDCTYLSTGYAYFANSYRLEGVPDGWSGAISDHGGPFVAALERGRTLACQFHPELSGKWGGDLLGRWLDAD
ncbi:MAG: imidazole glycerol phosphate synthase subunit HisH [Myxococcota bacterium]